jgi:hypothetical protein
VLAAGNQAGIWKLMDESHLVQVSQVALAPEPGMLGKHGHNVSWRGGVELDVHEASPNWRTEPPLACTACDQPRTADQVATRPGSGLQPQGRTAGESRSETPLLDESPDLCAAEPGR